LLKLGSVITPQLRNVGYKRSPRNRHYSYRKPLAVMLETR
jgi:hypothetical protein